MCAEFQDTSSWNEDWDLKIRLKSRKLHWHTKELTTNNKKPKNVYPSNEMIVQLVSVINKEKNIVNK